MSDVFQAADLEGIICSWCKRIKHLSNGWVEFADAMLPPVAAETISHGLCEPCYLRVSHEFMIKTARSSPRHGPVHD